jgi:hypothetical protein
MAGNYGETQALEQGAQQPCIRRGVLDELETVGTHRILEQIAHEYAPSLQRANSACDEIRCGDYSAQSRRRPDV